MPSSFLGSLDQIDYALAGGLAGLALFMLLWNVINTVRLARLTRKLETVESELEKRVLEAEKLRKERRESALAQAAPLAGTEAIEIVTSGVAQPEAAEASAVVEVSGVIEPSESQPFVVSDNASAPVSPAEAPASEPHIEIVQSDFYTASKPRSAEETGPEPSASKPESEAVMEAVEFEADLVSTGAVARGAIPGAGEPAAEPAQLEEIVCPEPQPAAMKRKEPETSLEEKMIDQFEKTMQQETRIRMFNPLKKEADFRIVREGLKKAQDEMASSIAIDLTDVFFIYPQEVAELRQQVDEFRKSGAKVQFLGVSGELRELLKVHGLDVDLA